MTHGVFSHETAAYMVQTGWPAGGRIVHPSAGAVVSHELGYGKGYKGLIPPYVVVTRPQGRFSEAGFLGTRYKPFATGGDPARTPFLVEGIASPGLTRSRQEKRKKLLAEVDRFAEELADDPRVRDFKDAQEKAYDLILGETGKVFDLSTEKKELRERYGNSSFGQSCLLARRLVEQGVPYITINYGGWDTHKKHFEEMRRKLPQLDRGLSTLLADLDAHGLLDECIVWWGGEFGRGPKVPVGCPVERWAQPLRPRLLECPGGRRLPRRPGRRRNRRQGRACHRTQDLPLGTCSAASTPSLASTPSCSCAIHRGSSFRCCPARIKSSSRAACSRSSSDA
jgi:hypothetical protein